MNSKELKFDQFINGQWVAPSNGKYDEVLNPANDELTFPFVLTGPAASAAYFEQIDAIFLNS